MPAWRFEVRRGAGALAIGAALALAGCAQSPVGGPTFTCATSIAEPPVFALIGGENAFMATRPGAGGVTVPTITISVEPEAFDFAVWDVLDLLGNHHPTGCSSPSCTAGRRRAWRTQRTRC